MLWAAVQERDRLGDELVRTTSPISRGRVLPFRNGEPAGEVAGFRHQLDAGASPGGVRGQPIAVFQIQDGSLLVTDDGDKKIWRVSSRNNG